LKLTLVNAPWVVASAEPLINLKNNETGNYLLEAVVYVLKKEHTGKIEEYVKQNFIARIS
jgi:hypothetical protein